MKKKYKFSTPQEYVELLTKANDSYYNTGEVIMSDKAYDELRDEFTERFPDHEFVKTVGAPIQAAAFSKVSHKIPMGSQSKINHPSELHDWFKKQFDKITELYKSAQSFFVVSEKVDGFSLSLNYEKGELTQAITRGDGVIGEDVTVNVKKMKAVPLKLNKKITGTFRGECVLFIEDFNEFFPDKANPRNAAAGTVRRLDGERCEHLTFLCYDVLTSDKELETEVEKFDLIKSLGFSTPEYTVCNTVEDVITLWSAYEQGKREQSKYEMDGLVVTFNLLAAQKVLGIIDQKPRYSRAFKFSAQIGETTIEEVNWFVGRTGRITPVAVVTPIKLSGVTITNITLHNLAEIKRLGVKIGSLVAMKRAGDVIPKIEQVLEEGKTEIDIPTQCPSCSHKTYQEDIFLWCKNELCPAQNYGNLLHWVKSLEIKGFGDELVQQLFDAKMITEPADFYTLTVEQIAGLDRRGEKSAKKVLEALHSKKELTVPFLIKGLGFSSISDKIAEVIQVKFPTLEEMMSAKESELSEIHGIGEIVAKNFVTGLAQRKDLIKNLLKHITLKEFKPVAGGPLEGKSFCFTGVRDKNLEKVIAEKGGKIASGVSKTLTVLVAKDPEENSSKLNKARELNVKILTLSEAQDLVSKDGKGL